ncbi:MAG: excinuclease ABC subunit A, partial [Streptomyces sp.]|nr:excinuclease ABC subunit A [Streptomyces sp.]
WIVDMGPEGGAGGGLVVAEGTPEEVAGVPASHTGKFLREILGADRVSDGSAVKAPRKAAARTTAKTATKTAAKKTVAARSTTKKTATAKTTAAATKKAASAKKAAPAKKATRARKA